MTCYHSHDHTIRIIPGNTGTVDHYLGYVFQDAERFDLGPGDLVFFAKDARGRKILTKTIPITSLADWVIVPLDVTETRLFQNAIRPRFEIEHRNADGHQRRVLAGRVEVLESIADD